MHSLVIEYLEMLPEKAVVWKSSGKAAGANTSQTLVRQTLNISL